VAGRQVLKPQDDAHIFCAREQLAGELASLLAFVLRLLRTFGLTEFEAELATRPERFVGTVEEWDQAQAALKEALDASGLDYLVAEGEGVFYAPKIDVHIRDAIGRRWQISTLQVDFQLPHRFDLEYTGADNARHRPFMIHRALFAPSSGSWPWCWSITLARCPPGWHPSRSGSSRSPTGTWTTRRWWPTPSGAPACARRLTPRAAGCRPRSGTPSSPRSPTSWWSATATSGPRR
jgi:hypothetical protein